MGSPLDFVNSDGFRKKLITKNLSPYDKSPKKFSPPLNYEYRQSDLSVVDSPDGLIDTTIFSENLYPLNQYGAEGGYKLVGDINTLNNTKANEGEYGFQDANIIEQSEVESKKWKSVNVYSTGSDILVDSADFFDSLNQPTTGRISPSNNQPYPSFNSSTYSPLSILLSEDPEGNNGLLSQDSFIARLGAQTLRKEFEQRIANNIRKETIGRSNVFNARGGTDILELVTGRVPLIEPNWSITVPQNPIIGAADFALKLAGNELPISPIAGSYFDPTINPKRPTTLVGSVLNTANNLVRGILGPSQTGSEIMYDNMGGGQKSRLFGNINYNKYRPSLDRTLFNRLLGEIVGNTENSGEYYIGSITSNPSRVFSPSGELPVDNFGREIQVPVYGPSELSKLYEGDNLDIKIGSNGVSYINGGGIEGGFTWVSPKYRGNAGKKVGTGGLVTNNNDDFSSTSFSSTESINQEYREGSILDDTQKLIDSQPLGGKRLQHVGNAIDQVSKVFNDGYKEITKGSKVLSYVGSIGQEVGTEYCRIFSKDIPYLQYNDLQKTDGIVDQGRKFSWSVLNNSYNLNIVPNKREGGQDSSNLIGTSTDNSYAKKYMFSIENLAWRTSNTPGLTVADLPVCERGPNGGRVMWFPPYDLKFSESVAANWKSNDFLGRPEPIYTYNNTTRTGSVSWKIVVDHPSVLNIIVNKVLENETNKSKIDSMLDSFFAGCLKYDLYELAKKYNNVKPDDLRVIQKFIGEKKFTKQQIEFIKETIENGSDGNNQTITYTPITSDPFKEFNGFAFYFENDFPKPSGITNYKQLYDVYTSEKNKNIYNLKSKGDEKKQVNSFFSSTIESNFQKINELINQIDSQLNTYPKGVITINLVASASAPATRTYNQSLSERRIKSAEDYIISHDKIKSWVAQGRLIIKKESLGEESLSQPLFKDSQTGDFKVSKVFNCSDEVDIVGGDVSVKSKETYTVGAMACRRTVIKSITNNLQEPVTPPRPEPQTRIISNVVDTTVIQPTIEEKIVDRNNITKFVLRQLLTECDYFETIKQDTPIVYDNLKQKLKFFQPAFHSITPEGLNSRLTFLQQCLRPGDTIPVVKEIDGGTILEYNNATNTAFGSPPVLILRVGDFYHTKIIPTTLSITYDDSPLDLNPEGIGIQPMIANVQLQFNFVGGHGLKTSIDKLQNALTFNYYANTEIYDDRADVTDESLTILDQEFLSQIKETSTPTINQAESSPGQNNGNTIGVILTKEINEFETGTIDYSNFMVDLKNSTERYFQTVTSKVRQSLLNYNNAVRQVWMYYRNYTLGTVFVSSEREDVIIFGKPKKVEESFSKITKKLENDINENLEGFIKFINTSSKNFSKRSISVIKQNYINYINRKSFSYQNGLTSITNEIVNEQLSYINKLGKANLILYKGGETNLDIGTDGFEQSNGNVVIYNTSGTTQVSANPTDGAENTYQELFNDYIKIKNDIKNFQNKVQLPVNFRYSVDKKQYQGILINAVNSKGYPLIESFDIDNVFTPFSTKPEFQDKIFRRVYMLISDDITDNNKYESFKTAIIGNVIDNESVIKKGRDNFEEVFDEYWKKKVLPLFQEENGITNEFVNYVENNTLSDYMTYNPFEKKERVFTFTSQPTNFPNQIETQTNLIKGLGATKNPTSNLNTWNDPIGVQFGYTSKIKFG